MFILSWFPLSSNLTETFMSDDKRQEVTGLTFGHKRALLYQLHVVM